MFYRWLAAVCALCLLLTGCSWIDGSYSSSRPHVGQSQWSEQDVISVGDYTQLVEALSQVLANGDEKATLSVEAMRRETVGDRMDDAIEWTLEYDPVAVYAVDEIKYELGYKGGYFVAEVYVKYNRKYGQLNQLKVVENSTGGVNAIYKALDDCEQSLVFKTNGYVAMDYTQVVLEYAQKNPDKVMEIPVVAASEYPKSGSVRVVELIFTYQTDKKSLQDMQLYVQPVFEAASMYVGSESNDRTKLSRLYTFLMGRNTYTVETSITPAYSLLRHGVGDSKALATVYAAMCNDVGVQCMVVSGTKRGEPWTWNIIREHDRYYHIDLLEAFAQGGYRRMTDREMVGYVWDYTAFPACEDS